MGHDLHKVESDYRYLAFRNDVGRKTSSAAAKPNADHGRERAVTIGQLHLRGQCKGLAILGHVNGERVVLGFSLDVFGANGLLTDSVVFYFTFNLRLPATPVFELG